MTGNADKIWFPAKTYGWGWGAPVKWQGWAVLGAYLFLVLGISVLLPGVSRSIGIGVLTILLFGVVIWKGERPRWRWGR